MTKSAFQAACRLAATQIEKDGLCKDGSFGRDDGPKCAIGALRFVVTGSVQRRLPTSGEQVTEFFKAARPRTRRDNIVSFNDAERTRRHDVVALLRDMATV